MPLSKTIEKTAILGKKSKTYSLLTATALSALLTFSRPSVATDTDVNGFLASYASGAARITYDPLDYLNGLGTHFEGAITNKFTGFNANPIIGTPGFTFSNSVNGLASWGIVDDKAELFRVGLHSLCTSYQVYKLDNTLGDTVAYLKSIGQTSNLNTHTVSAYIRGIGQAAIRNGYTVGNVVGLTPYYKRISFSFTPGAITDQFWLAAYPGSIVYAILPQIEENPFVTSVIVTAGSAVTKSADVYTLALPKINAQGVTKFSCVINGKAAPGGGTLNQYIGQFYADLNNTINIYRATNRTIQFQVVVAGASYAGSVGSTVIPDNTSFNLAFTIFNNTIHASLNGATPVVLTPTNGIPSGLNTLYMGDNVTSIRTWWGTISKFDFYPKVALSDAQLQAASQIQTIDLVSEGLLNPYVTYSRTGNELWYDAGGVLRTAGANLTFPQYYNQYGNMLAGYMSEPAMTNLNTNYNANPTDATNIGRTPATNGLDTFTIVDDSVELKRVGLDQICTSGKVYKLDNTLGDTQSIANFLGNTAATGVHVGSVYIRSTGTGLVQIASSLSSDGSFNVPNSNTYKRQFVTINPTAARSFGVRVNAGSVAYFILNQLEANTFATTPIVVAGAAATRTADSATIPFATLGITNPRQFSVQVNARTPSITRTSSEFLFEAYTDVNNRITVYMPASQALNLYVANGGVAQTFAIITSPNLKYDTPIGLYLSVNENTIKVSVNGGAIQTFTLTTITLPNVINLGIGTGALTGFQWTAPIKKMVFKNYAVDDLSLMSGSLLDNVTLVSNGVLNSICTFTRTGTATEFDQTKTLFSYASGISRTAFIAANGLLNGLLIEGASTNYVRNSTMQGVVAGTPGTIPTNWTMATSQNGLSRTVVGSGIEFGMTYVDVQLVGTSTGTAGYSLFMEQAGIIAAANGQTWTSSVYARLVGGDLTNITSLSIFQRVTDNTQAFLNNLGTTGNIALTSALQRFQTTGTIANATAAYIHPQISFLPALGAINITIRIYAPQIEQYPFATTFIPTTTASITRNAENAYFTLANVGLTGMPSWGEQIWINLSNGTPSSSNVQHLTSIIFSVTTYFVIWRDNINKINARLYVNNVSQGLLQFGTVTNGQMIGIMYTYINGVLKICLNGGVVQTINFNADINSLGAVTAKGIGGFGPGSSTVPSNGYTRLNRLFSNPSAINDNQLQQMSVAA